MLNYILVSLHIETKTQSIMITADQIRKITGRAALEFDQNPKFVSFKNLSIASASSSVNKLKLNGFNAIRLENYIKISI